MRYPTLLLVEALAFLIPALAEQKTDNLRSLDLENLLSTTVTSVRRKEESQSRAAGALYVITQEQIRRSGVTSIPEALRLVPGLNVARIGLNSWAISSRGFNHVYANKLLVMVDGRTVYSPMVGGVFWDSIDTLLEDIDRIEVLRGPGAAMWGSNAVNGVIHIITRPAQRSQGGLVTVGGGSEDRALTRLRYGGTAGSRGYYRVYGHQTLRAGAASTDRSLGDDRWSMAQGGMRADWTLSDRDTLTVQGDVFRSGARFLNATFTLTPPFATARMERSEGLGGNVLARWEHTHRSGGVSQVQSYIDVTRRDDAVINFSLQTVDFDYQYRHPNWGRNELSVAVGGRVNTDSTRPSGLLSFNSNGSRYGFGAITLQDDINLWTDRLSATVAVRLERNSLTGWNSQPTVRLLATPNRRHTLWTAWSQSVRVPSRGELGGGTAVVRVVPMSPLPLAAVVIANPGLANERGNSLEFGYRAQLHRRLMVDSTVFRTKTDGVLSFLPGQPAPRVAGALRYIELPLYYRNQIDTETRGWETSLRYTVRDTLQVSGAYTWIQFSKISGANAGTATASPIDPAVLVASVPAHQFQARSEWRPSRRWELDLGYFYYGPRINAGSGSQTARHRADVRIGWFASDSTELSVGIQNLGGRNSIEFSSEPGPIARPINPSAYLRLSFHF